MLKKLINIIGNVRIVVMLSMLEQNGTVPWLKRAQVLWSPTRWQHCHSCPNSWVHKKMKRVIQRLTRQTSTWDSMLFITYPTSSKWSLSTAQMVTHTVGVPNVKHDTIINKDASRVGLCVCVCVCVMRLTSHPSQWWCTSRSIFFQGRRFLPVKWKGTAPQWRARSS